MRTLKRLAFGCFVLASVFAFKVHANAYYVGNSNWCYGPLGYGYYNCWVYVSDDDAIDASEEYDICSQAESYCPDGPGFPVGVEFCHVEDDFIWMSCLRYQQPDGCEVTGCEVGYQCFAGTCQPLG